MNDIVHIVTPVSRLTYLEQIYKSIVDLNPKCKWLWHCCIDTRTIKSEIPKFSDQQINYYIENKLPNMIDNHRITRDSTPSLLRNTAIDNIREGWIHFVDDDNKVHPNWFNLFYKMRQYYPFAIGMTVIGEHNDNTLRCIPHPYSKNMLDTANYTFHISALKNVRWSYTGTLNDPFFYNEVDSHHHDKIAHMSDVGCYYNYFKPNIQIL